MGRPLRRQAAGQYYLFTTRCHQARFFLRPDRNLNRAVLEWLVRGQMRFPSIRIYAVCVMSNHLHLVLRDDKGELSAWANYVLGNLARAVNRLRGRSGTFFERRYSAEPILDVEALHDRLVYVVTNPVKAALCARSSSWPGVVLFARGEERHEVRVSWIDRTASRLARSRAGSGDRAARAVAVVENGATLILHPIPAIDAASSDSAATSVAAREQMLASERSLVRRRTLTTAVILAQNWHSAPRKSQRSPRPHCHAADPVLRAEFMEGFRTFVGAFREASRRLLEGAGQVSFPEWSFPPGSGLIQPALSGYEPLPA